MSITAAHVYLIYPGRGQTDPQEVVGQAVPLTGKLYDMLQKLFIAQASEKDFEIVFSPSEDGKQFNECRKLLLDYQSTPSDETGLAIALRLQSFTDGRSGAGLLFVMVGQYGTNHRLVLSRFPADEAILADTGGGQLNVELLDQVFIRRMTAYKALLLESPSPPNEYWNGTATDRQAGGDAEHISAYWIRDFLCAQFAESPKAATRRLAEALQSAMKAHPNLEVKSRIAGAISLAPKMFDNKMISTRDFCKTLAFEKDIVDTIVNTLNKPSIADKVFKFSAKDFVKKLPTRVIEMESGAKLSGPSQSFDSLFKKVDDENGIVEYRIKGKISDERVQK